LTFPLIFSRSQEFNETSFDEWADAAKAPTLPSSLNLYNQLQGLGFHIILLTGRIEFQRNATELNLLSAGYNSWEKLILRYENDILSMFIDLYQKKRKKSFFLPLNYCLNSILAIKLQNQTTSF
jgi:hypothetical protein